MKLLMAGPSPFVRKVMVTLHETDQKNAVEYERVVASPTGPSPELIAANPVGKIPALIRPDAPALYDSRVICRFLNARVGGTLYPEKRQWDVLTLEATGDGIMEAAVLMIYEERFRPEQKRSSEWVEAQWAKIDRAVSALNTRWVSHLHGPLDIGQISVACALSYLDYRHAARQWRTGNTALADWYKVFAERPSMVETEPSD
ncbi:MULTISPECIES: glutathione S-transferase family protein [unclassified Marinovum]